MARGEEEEDDDEDEDDRCVVIRGCTEENLLPNAVAETRKVIKSKHARI